MRRHIAAAAIAAAALTSGAGTINATAAPDNGPGEGIPHCQTEDAGRHCTWNIGLPWDGNGHGRAFYRDWYGHVQYAPDCFTILRKASYEFPRKAHRVFRICLRNSDALRLVRRGSDADMEHAVMRTHHHMLYQGRYQGHRHVFYVGGPTSVYIARDGWFTTS